MMTARSWALPLLLAAAPAVCQDETPAIQRSLADLHLGDTIEDVQLIYPPAQEWPAQEERRVRVTRLRVERETAKSFPQDAQVLWLGLRRGRLVDIQLIYDARFSRRRPAERLAQDLALVYGEPHRSNDKFWWTDGRTVLRVFDAELPAQPGAQRSVALRTSVQILERALFLRSD
ncbi:MAG: hypothetical protein NTY77_20125 [Elusimicrobia bacterium]|nr:hypothetical protein [Elusimicrobiota bacterium]